MLVILINISAQNNFFQNWLIVCSLLVTAFLVSGILLFKKFPRNFPEELLFQTDGASGTSSAGLPIAALRAVQIKVYETEVWIKSRNLFYAFAAWIGGFWHRISISDIYYVQSEEAHVKIVFRGYLDMKSVLIIRSGHNEQLFGTLKSIISRHNEQ